jgi:hypothetical protein
LKQYVIIDKIWHKIEEWNHPRYLEDDYRAVIHDFFIYLSSYAKKGNIAASAWIISQGALVFHEGEPQVPLSIEDFFLFLGNSKNLNFEEVNGSRALLLYDLMFNCFTTTYCKNSGQLILALNQSLPIESHNVHDLVRYIINSFRVNPTNLDILSIEPALVLLRLVFYKNSIHEASFIRDRSHVYVDNIHELLIPHFAPFKAEIIQVISALQGNEQYDSAFIDGLLKTLTELGGEPENQAENTNNFSMY